MKRLWALIVNDVRFIPFTAFLALYGLMRVLSSVLDRGSWPLKVTVMLGAFALLGVVALGAQILWALVSWASVPDAASSTHDERIKRWLLIVALVAPPLLVARPGMDFQAIVRSVTSLYFIGAMVLVGWLARTFAKSRQFPRLKTYLIVYTAVIIIMGLGYLGVWRQLASDDEDGYPQEEPVASSPLTEREQLLRGIIFYSIAGFLGVYSTRRKSEPI